MDESDSESDRFLELPPESAKSNTLEQAAFSSAMVTDDLSDEEEESVRPQNNPHDEILWAAEHGNLELVQKLIASDEKLLNASDKDGYTVLHRATYNRYVEVVKWLVNKGVDFEARTAESWTPLHSACHWNSAECVALFLSLGANINVRSKGNITPLHLASANSNGRDILELLLSDPNIDVDIKNNSNETAFEIARRKGRNVDLFEMTESCFRLFPI